MEITGNICQREQIEGFDLLAELALNLCCSWNHRADVIWKQLDATLWEETCNPWMIIQTVSKEKLELLLQDKQTRSFIEEMVSANRTEIDPSSWFQKNHAHSPLQSIAYFSMEYMLTEALPIYSGGLGNVAGDQLKAASDLGVPVSAVGLLYQQGYFRQILDRDGKQQALFPYNDPGQLPIMPLRTSNGEWLRLHIQLPGYSIWLRTWHARVGRLDLYLLDSNDMANFPAHRGITTELYGGGVERRLQQELILGIGGWRLLQTLGITPQVCHLNEGHAAFAILERARDYMEKHNVSFAVALAVTRAGNLFTTHTAVPAGFDRFSPELIEHYLGGYTKNKLTISLKELLALGRSNPNDDCEDFNMAYLAIRGCGAVNGVSKLHKEVSQKIFSPLFPRWPEKEVPIGHVTNGVHMSSWDAAESDTLWTEMCGKRRWIETTECLGEKIHSATDAQIWSMRNQQRHSLVAYANKRLKRQLAVAGTFSEESEIPTHCFHSEVLTLGFARRFAEYKRPNLLLHNPEKLLRILNSSTYPVQLIVAGKAHPADKVGQKLIEEWSHFIKNSNTNGKVIFLSDYDILLAEHLVRGIDVWVNTPRRPWEACGTSGMKVLVNGGLNLSELDGWWAEAYTPDVGWALGGDNPTHSDADDAEALYTLLTEQVIPEFYRRSPEGIPSEWVSRIRKSMASLTGKFSSNRCVREYTEKYYLPAAETYARRCSDESLAARQLLDWKQEMRSFGNITFGPTEIESSADTHTFRQFLSLPQLLDEKYIQVQLYADGNPEDAVHKMTRIDNGNETTSTLCYTASVSAERPAADYTPRVVPNFPEAILPLEECQILWKS